MTNMSGRTNVRVSPVAQVACLVEQVRAKTRINDGSSWDGGVDRALDNIAPLFVSLLLDVQVAAAEAVREAEYEANESINRAGLDDDDE
jgi:hypothetical protein